MTKAQVTTYVASWFQVWKSQVKVARISNTLWMATCQFGGTGEVYLFDVSNPDNIVVRHGLAIVQKIARTFDQG